MSYFPTRILLATDGSEDTLAATRAAVDLAVRTGSELHVVHVFEFIPVREYAGVALRMRSPMELEEEAQRTLEQEVEDIEEIGGVVADARMRLGSPAGQILSAAREIEAGLIVMGRRNLGDMKRLFSGSISEKVLRHAECPVLTLRGVEDAWPPARVVISDDFSVNAREAGELAASIGSLYGAEGLLVHVYLSPSEDALRSDPRLSEHDLEQIEADLRDRTGDLERILGGRVGVELVQGRGVAGEIARSPIEATRDVKGATLISVGRREFGKLRRMRAGSVSTEIARVAAGPVLVCPHS